jgi:hypothetical protein
MGIKVELGLNKCETNVELEWNNMGTSETWMVCAVCGTIWNDSGT